MNLGSRSVGAGRNRDSERQLLQGGRTCREDRRPYLEVACLAEMAFAAKIEPFSHDAAAVAGGDSAGRAEWLGRGAGNLAGDS